MLITICAYLATIACGWLNSYIFLTYSYGGGTHQTGNTTKVALNIISGDFMLVLVLLGLIGSYVLGALISGLLNPHKDLRYPYLFGIFAIVFSSALFVLFYFLRESYILNLYSGFLAGFLNGIFSQYKFRVSHLTGCLVDLGISTGKFITQQLMPKNMRVFVRKELRITMLMNIITLSCFFAGVLLGALLNKSIDPFYAYLSISIYFVAISCYYLILSYIERKKNSFDTNS